MTQEEFFSYTQIHPDQVNIWYDTGGPPYVIKAITIPVLDNSNPPQDRSALLENVQQITVPLTTGEVLNLNVTTTALIQSPGTLVMPVTKYYYYNIDPIILTNIGSTNIAAGNLIFSPSLDAALFTDSAYNVLGGSIESGRQSTYIMQADRYKIGTLANPTYLGPLNIDKLLSGSATKADVQDSNYASTGWINGRYEGTKTDRIDYLTEPAISGKFFQASEFPSGSTPGQINYLISSSQVIYKDYFFAGVGDTPGFVPEYSGYKSTAQYGPNTTAITIRPEVAGTTPNAIKVGDLIKFQSSNEIMYVEAVGFQSAVTYTLLVRRGYFGDIAPLISVDELLYRVRQVQIYNVTGNRLSGVPKGKILVKETGAIVTLDPLGFVISST